MRISDWSSDVCSSDLWSPAVLLRCLRIQEGIDLFLERHFFFLARRQRTFAEARQALSRDLHDSVLQTLAALRVRLATTIHGLSDAAVPDQLTELKANGNAQCRERVCQYV